MKSIRWLHLTDLHQGTQDQDWLWPDMRQIFEEDLAHLPDVIGGVDLILFTGDLTNRGTDEEFTRLDQTLSWLRQRLRALFGAAPALLAVPGNHDLVRPTRARAATLDALRQWDRLPTVQRQFFEFPSGEYRQVVNQAFEAYLRWAHRQPVPDWIQVTRGAIPGDFSATVTRDGLRLGVVGMNSAFLHLHDAPAGRLALHPNQLSGLCPPDLPGWVDAHDAALLLSHHPPDWLSDKAQKAYREEIYPAGRFAAHLCGHLHELPAAPGDDPGRRLLVGRSLFGLPTFGPAEEPRSHGYSVGALVREADGALALHLWPRRLVRDGRGAHLVPDERFTMDPQADTVRVVWRPAPPSGSAPLLISDSDSADIDAAAPRTPMTGSSRSSQRSAASGTGRVSGVMTGRRRRRTSPTGVRRLVPPGSRFQPDWYIHRPSEEAMALDLLNQPGQPAVLSAPWGFGKSQMLHYLCHHLEQEAAGDEDQILPISLREILHDLEVRGQPATDLPVLLRELGERLTSKVGLPPEVLEQSFAGAGTATHRFNNLLGKQILPRVRGRLVLAIDRADAVLSQPYGNELFAIMRGWAEKGVADEAWSRLRLILTISTTVAYLTRKNKRGSPFNLTPPIVLPDFDDAQIDQLIGLHVSPRERPRLGLNAAGIAAVRACIGGHPRLWHTLMWHAVAKRQTPAELMGARCGADLFSDHLRELERQIPGDKLRRIIHDIQAGRLRQVDAETRHRLESAGIIAKGADETVRLRYNLYHALFSGSGDG